MIRGNYRMHECVGCFARAFVPFPRSTWIHPHVPHDNFDYVCEVIWARAKASGQKFGRGQSTADNNWTDEQQKNTNDFSENLQCEEETQQHHRTELTLPCPYLSGRRHPRVAKSARAPSPVMEEKLKLNKEETERKGNLEKGETWHLGYSLKKIWVPESKSQARASTPVRSASENPSPHLSTERDLPLASDLSSDTSESVGEQKTSNSSDGQSSDDDTDDDVILPGVRSCATDSDIDSESDTSYSEESEKSHIETSSVDEQGSQSLFLKKDFPPLVTMRDGGRRYPTKPPASGKMHGQWEIPLSFHPPNIPTDMLASSPAAPVQESVQGKAETPQATSKTIAPVVAQTQQGPYDLLADFPALQPPMRPLALGELHDGNPKTKDAMGKREIIQQPNHHPETEASYESGMKNVPREVAICARDQKFEPNPQTSSSLSISCETNNQPPRKVAGTDGAGVNARSWARAAKAGMKQAAAPQETARPCSFQQILTINRARAVNHNTTNKVSPSLISHRSKDRGVRPLEAGWYRGPRSCNPNRFVRPGYLPSQQRFGALAPRRANCPLRFLPPPPFSSPTGQRQL